MKNRTNLFTALFIFVAAIAAFTVTAGAQSNEKSPRKDLTKVVKKAKKETTAARPYANAQDHRPPRPQDPAPPRKKPIIPIKKTLTTAYRVEAVQVEGETKAPVIKKHIWVNKPDLKAAFVAPPFAGYPMSRDAKKPKEQPKEQSKKK